MKKVGGLFGDISSREIYGIWIKNVLQEVKKGKKYWQNQRLIDETQVLIHYHTLPIDSSLGDSNGKTAL